MACTRGGYHGDWEGRMNLYLISQSQWTGYDTFDSAVVCAESEDQARDMHPGGGASVSARLRDGDWASSPEHVSVRFLGVASPDLQQCVVCASFNAG